MDIYAIMVCAALGLFAGVLILLIVSELRHKRRRRQARRRAERSWQREIHAQDFHRRMLEVQAIRQREREKRVRAQQQVAPKAEKVERGTSSERELVSTLLQVDIPREVIFHDLYVKKENGRFSQIDVVVATPVGIIVFEVKEYSGRIFANTKQSKWIQILPHGKQRYRFQNPLRQNNGHIRALKKHLEPFGDIPFHSVVVFYGNCELAGEFSGTSVVKSERVMECVAEIWKEAPARYTDKMGMIEVLKQAVRNGEDEQVRARHVENIREMLGSERIFA